VFFTLTFITQWMYVLLKADLKPIKYNYVRAFVDIVRKPDGFMFNVGNSTKRRILFF